MTDEPVLIVGAGIAGLAFALGLHARGIHCRVLEAAPQITELGVGITLLPHAVRELTALGVINAVREAGIETRASAFYNRFGQQLFAEPRGMFAGNPYPEFGIHRGKLHGILYRAVLDRLGRASVTTDCRAERVEQGEHGVTLHCRRQSEGAPLPPVSGRLAVACDGVNSAIRRQYYPDERVAFTGINTWRGVTRMPPYLDGRTYLRVGSLRTGKIVIYPIIEDGGGTQLVNWVAEIERDAAEPNDWNRAGNADDFVSIFESFVFDWLNIPAMIRAADRIFEYPMVDKDPVDRWTFGRVTFMGDAAHPMYPRGSNGSAQALIDARVLADHLARGGPVDAALCAYEAERRPATAAIVRANRSNPPDIINLHVEDLVGDQPFDNLEDYVSQTELRALSDRYKQIAGFSAIDLKA